MTFRLLAIVVALAAGLGCFVEWERAQAREADDAVMALRTIRFGPTTRARLGTWFRSVEPQAKISWRAEPRGFFDDQSVVELMVVTADASKRYRFAVDTDHRTAEPLDPASRALVGGIRAWAAQ